MKWNEHYALDNRYNLHNIDQFEAPLMSVLSTSKFSCLSFIVNARVMAIYAATMLAHN